MELSVILPIYNEAENIPYLLSELKGVLDEITPDYEILCINDGSTDKSAVLIEEAKEHDPRIILVNFAYNAGQSAAFSAGFKLAKGKYVITMDADLQNDPADIPKLLEKIKEYDVVIGWRTQRNDSWVKKISSKIGNGVRNWLTGDDIHDTGCSLKVFRNEVVKKIPMFSGMHRFLPTLAKIEGYSVCQVPVNHRPRKYGVSKYGIFNRAWSGLKDVLAVRWMKARHINYEIKEIK
ncbi:MAG: glycosyltransferase family 2 protein [Firmicutes bacterium]|nr:glycosyltransferase family 2 protein [Bacillota bacterium]